MDLVLVVALVLIPFIAGIMAGWGLRSLLSMHRRERTSPTPRRLIEVNAPRPKWLDESNGPNLIRTQKPRSQFDFGAFIATKNACRGSDGGRLEKIEHPPSGAA
jgi:hypothetical protein